MMAFMMFIAVGSAYAAKLGESGLPPCTIPECLGVNIHFTGPEEKQISQIESTGVKFIRMDVLWHNVEKEKGKYDFKGYEELADTLAKHGIRPLFILCYGNKLYDNGQSPYTDEGRAAFVRFVQEVVPKFKGKGILWEIWNEPNGGNFWFPHPSYEDYVKLASEVYSTIKKADPNAKVVGPALAGLDYDYFENCCKLGLLKSVDAVSLHAYGCIKPEEATQYYTRIRSIIKKYAPEGRSYKIISGEWGYPAVGDTNVDKQAEYMTRSLLINVMNSLPLSIWYDWHDDGPDPNDGEHHFGLLYLDFKEKPTYFAMRTLTTELNGYSFAARLYSESDYDYLLLFKKGENYRLAAWTIGDTHKIKFPLDVPDVKTVSLTGIASSSKTKDGVLELELTGGVKYVEPTTPSKRWAMEASWKIDAEVARSDKGDTAAITSVIDNTPASGKMEVTGHGLQNTIVPIDPKMLKDSHLKLVAESPYVANGESARVKVTLTLDGVEKPLVRMVDMDTSVCLSLEVLPPSKKDLLFMIKKSTQDKGEMKGKLTVGNYDGIRLTKDSVDFAIPKDEDKTIVRVPMAQEPAAIYSFAFKVVDDKNQQLLRCRSRRYSVLEFFDDGKAGSAVSKYQCILDGDDKIPATAKLTYTGAPSGSPTNSCAKLEYDLAKGWRFIRISCAPQISIYERPKSVKMWIHPTNNGGLGRLRIVDSGEQAFQPEFGRLNFNEWRCLEARLTGEGAGHWGGKDDGKVRYPISWDTIFLFDSCGDKAKGDLYLGPMMVCYD